MTSSLWNIFGDHFVCFSIYKTLFLVSLDKKIEQELWNQCYKSPISYLQEQQKENFENNFDFFQIFQFFDNFSFLNLIKSKTTKPEMRQEAALNLSELLEQEIGRRFMPDLTLERKVGIFDLY